MKHYTRVLARVDLDAVEYNIEMMKKNIQKDTQMMAVIKMDGYGHGAVQIVKLLEPKDYIWGYAVATLDEAILLKDACLKKPVLVLGCIFPDQWDTMIRNEVRMTVYSYEMAKEVSELAEAMGCKVYVHIKLDTGMARLGFQITEENAEEIAKISKLPNLVMEGMFTHFSKSDEADKTFTNEQLDKYLWMKEELKKRGVTFQYYHCSNSAGIIDLKEANMDIVRAGITTYGMYPSDEVEKERVPLKPAMELISHVAHVKWLTEGKQVAEMYYSYDGETIGYIINMPYRDSSWGVDFEDSVEKKYSKEIHKCKINITLYEIEDSNVPKCVAKFKYGNIEYMLMGTMSEQNFEKILKNLFFPK